VGFDGHRNNSLTLVPTDLSGAWHFFYNLNYLKLIFYVFTIKCIGFWHYFCTLSGSDANKGSFWLANGLISFHKLS